MTPYRNWKIRSKLLVPLIGMGLASSILVFATAYLVFQDLRNHTLLEMESAYELRSKVIKLVGDYREYLIHPVPEVRREVDQTKIGVVRAFDRLHEAFASEKYALMETKQRGLQEDKSLTRVQDGLMRLEALGEQSMAVRDAIDRAGMNLEAYEEALVKAAAWLQEIEARQLAGVSQSSDPRVLAQVALKHYGTLGSLQSALQAFISETRDYVIEPSADARADLGALEDDIARYIAALDQAAGRGHEEIALLETVKSILPRLKVQSAETIRQRDNQTAAREALDRAAEAFKADLRILTESVSEEADGAVRSGLIAVLLVVFTTIVLTSVVQWWVAQSLAMPISELRDATTKFGEGDLAARYRTDRKDEVGELAQAFNEMAGNLAANIKALGEAQEELVRKERLAAIGQLTATVSHELRNPLGAIRSATDAIAKMVDDKDSQMGRAFSLLERGQTRCDKIIEELLDYTRVQELESRATRIDDWLTEVLEAYPTPSGITLEKKLGSRAEIDLDRHRLERALHNLLDNACHAMDRDSAEAAGGIENKLVVSTRNTGDRVELVVTDSGKGIPPEVRDKIFEPLYSSKSFGIGLGLPTVRQIIEQHGGGVQINSAAGKGTEVVLWLPLKNGEARA